MPVETRLLREAGYRGCATVPGVRMQLHQAARQFELYTGVVPDLAVMERALLDVMEKE
jgi:shikimate dehydrogenase